MNTDRKEGKVAIVCDLKMYMLFYELLKFMLINLCLQGLILSNYKLFYFCCQFFKALFLNEKLIGYYVATNLWRFDYSFMKIESTKPVIHRDVIWGGAAI